MPQPLSAICYLLYVPGINRSDAQATHTPSIRSCSISFGSASDSTKAFVRMRSGPTTKGAIFPNFSAEMIAATVPADRIKACFNSSSSTENVDLLDGSSAGGHQFAAQDFATQNNHFHQRQLGERRCHR